MNDKLIVRGARDHNLKNINVELPKNKLIVFTGVSGSGKSTLAFDTIYAEGQRRYVESLSAYARQFLGIMGKPDIDSIEGLSPAISIDQKSTSHNPRSTVGTVTEIYDYLRLLFARIGHPHCPNCGREVSRMDKEQITETLKNMVDELVDQSGSKPIRFFIFAPVVRDRKGEFSGLLDNLKQKGYQSARIDKNIINLNHDIVLIKTNRHSVDVIIDRFSVTKKMMKDEVSRANFISRIRSAVEQALDLSDGLVILSQINDSGFEFPERPKEMVDHLFSEKLACPHCNISFSEIEPRIFSFNSPHGACPECKGLGTLLKINPDRVLNPNLSITEGGILPFSKQFVNDTWYSRLIITAVQENGVDPRSQIKHYTPEQRNIILNGTGNKLYEVEGTNRFGDITHITEPFTGIVTELQRKLSESGSDYVRNEIEKYMQSEVCNVCAGTRLSKEARTVTIQKKSISDINDLSVRDTHAFFENLQKKEMLSDREKIIAGPILKEVIQRLEFLIAVGLDYLTLGRSATTLAGGEAQRIRLASQIGSGLSGVLYVLDEPSIGLHQRDNRRLIDTLEHLRDLGNTVLVVEHDREMIESADYIVDFGPEGGKRGGVIVAQGSVEDIKNNPASITGAFLSGKQIIETDEKMKRTRAEKKSKELILHGAHQFSLKNIDVTIPLNKFVCVTGLSGSGKSTLIVETLYKALKNHFNPYYRDSAGIYRALEGVEYIKSVHLIDQSPIGKTPRSNPATYVGAFTYMRSLFAEMKEAKAQGYTPGRFSFNVKGGRCENCEGQGEEKIEMQFLPPVWVKCEVCNGTRYNTATLEIKFKGKNIAEVLDMTVVEAYDFFKNIPGLSNKLETLNEVGLDYIKLGQPAPTLSGGEAQRVKLASELSKRGSSDNLYILDEPTTGLHFADLVKLLHVLQQLVEVGNTVLVIEHNLEIIKNADYIIDLGPEGGDLGGEVVAQGTPEEVAKVKESYTGQLLKEIL
ncbi:MAG: excinuclease ABC subunit A, excinuclease ABC subunit A [Microgenomates group bacterium GW2011_GWC1_41_8]|nr:MAG: excinuclease ABC subunit A, excinuclease ABC subunit A [Microgenomates group bacterium GW2011_GWC1_41_8]